MSENQNRSTLEAALAAPVRAALGGPSRAVTSAVAERVAEILIEEGVVERTVQRALRDPSTERAAVAVLDSDLLDELTTRLLASQEIQQVIERIANAPEVRNAITRQGVGLLDDLRRELTKQARNADSLAEHLPRTLFRRGRREGSVSYAGGVTRLIAIALDAGLFNLFTLGISTLIALLINAVTGDNPGGVQAALAGVGVWVLGAVIYLSTFWSLTGQTPGMRFMSIELQAEEGGRIGFGRGVRRIVGMILGAIPFFLGYLGLFTNERRRGFQDRIARTVVLYRDDSPGALPPGPSR